LMPPRKCFPSLPMRKISFLSGEFRLKRQRASRRNGKRFSADGRMP